jgi:hypothetical protein
VRARVREKTYQENDQGEDGSERYETKNDSQEGGAVGAHRNVILLFVGATVFAVLATAVLAVLNAAVGGAGNSTPTEGGLVPVGSGVRNSPPRR